ncbi:MAG: hypothetical protein RAK17_05165 [Caldisphaera sp.]|nr:hypothetical protein [Caldisphaera sp.]
MLNFQSIEALEASEAYISSANPFTGEKLKKGKQLVEKIIKVFNPYLITGSALEGKGIKVVKVINRYLDDKDDLLERDSIVPFVPTLSFQSFFTHDQV